MLDYSMTNLAALDCFFLKIKCALITEFGLLRWIKIVRKVRLFVFLVFDEKIVREAIGSSINPALVFSYQYIVPYTKVTPTIWSKNDFWILLSLLITAARTFSWGLNFRWFMLGRSEIESKRSLKSWFSFCIPSEPLLVNSSLIVSWAFTSIPEKVHPGHLSEYQSETVRHFNDSLRIVCAQRVNYPAENEEIPLLTVVMNQFGLLFFSIKHICKSS